MKNRLEQLLEKKKLTPARFAEIVGVQRSSVSHVLSGRNNPSLEFIQKILAAFPEVSSDWLINGTGNIFRELKTIDEGLSNKMQFINTREGKENDLFSSLAASNASADNRANQGNPAYNLSQSQEKHLPGTSPGGNLPPRVRVPGVERIVIFYEDRTFKEFYPSI